MSTGGTKKTTSNQTTNSSSNFTTTPNTPEFASTPVQNYFSLANSFANQVAQNPNYLATPANDLQNTAYNNAYNLPTGTDQLSQANALATKAGSSPANTASYTGYSAPQIGAGGTVQAATLLDNLDSYFNPYLNKVIDTTLADYDANAAIRRGDALAAAGKNRGFSGSSFAIGQGALEGELARGRATTDANLRSAGFDRATTLSGQDADRRQSASTANAQMAMQRALAQANLDASAGQFNASAYNDTSRFNAGQGDNALARALAASGQLASNASTGSNIANQNLASQLGVGSSLYDIDRQNAGAQLQGLQGLASLLDPSLYSQFVGQNVTGYENGTSDGTATEKSSGGLLGQILGPVAGAFGKAGAAALFSDERLKTDIRRVGRTDGGLPIYTYRYKGDDTPQMGVIAQDVEQMQPEALGPIVGGYKTVFYQEVR